MPVVGDFTQIVGNTPVTIGEKNRVWEKISIPVVGILVRLLF